MIESRVLHSTLMLPKATCGDTSTWWLTKCLPMFNSPLTNNINYTWSSRDAFLSFVLWFGFGSLIPSQSKGASALTCRSCCIVPCRAVPCDTVLYRAVPFVLCRVVPSCIMPFGIVPCRSVSCRAIVCRVVSCCTVSCRAVSCRVVSCRVVSCRAVGDQTFLK